jgi:transcriptional regulator GlxA family with amidase domain
MKQVVILVPKCKVVLASITGPFEILTRANEIWKQSGKKSLMEVHIASFEKGLTLDSGYFSIHPTAVKELRKADLLIIPSLSHDYERIVKDNKEAISWIREQYKGGAEVASICTGAFLLAATGLLDGRTCSTHWNAEKDFKRMFPKITLHIDKLITAERGIFTNGGAYSFLNMVLFLVEKYFDRPTAIMCSKIFQIDIERTSQSAFYVFQAQKNHGDTVVSRAQTYIEENLSEKISFEDLSGKLATSRRNFDRRFIKATGNTPVEYLQRVKVEVAKKNLEEGRKSIFDVMREVGYSDDKAFRDVFKKLTGFSPFEYREKYLNEVRLA